MPINAQGFLSATESFPHSYVSGTDKQRVIHIEQDVWEVSANGELAEGWAGPISMAFGYGFRKESFTQVVEVGPGGNINGDPRFRPVMANNAALGIRGVPGGALASGNSVEIQFSNVPFARGEQDVAEAFTEFLVPLVSGVKGVQQLNLSAAARWADYSGAGHQESWKTGLDWAIIDQVRLRTTVSQDVRAATMGEKFDRTGGFTAPLSDYGIIPTPAQYTATQFSNGTPDIKPEQARTGDFRYRLPAGSDRQLERFRRLLLHHHRGQHPAGRGPDRRHRLLPAKRSVPVLTDHSWRPAERRESRDQLHLADRRALLQPGTHRGQGHRLRGELSQGRRLVRRWRGHRPALLGQLSRRAHRHQCRGCEDLARGHVRGRTRRPTRAYRRRRP